MTGPNALPPPQGPPSAEFVVPPPPEIGRAVLDAAEADVVPVSDTFDSVGSLFASYEASGFKPREVTQGPVGGGDFTLAFLKNPDDQYARTYKGALTTTQDGKPVTRELPRVWQWDFPDGSDMSFYTGDNPQVLAAIAAAEGAYDHEDGDAFGYELKEVLADPSLVKPGEIIKTNDGNDHETNMRNTTFDQIVTVQ